MLKVIRKNQIFILLIGMFITIPEVFLGNDRIETVKELMESGQLHLVRQQIAKLAEGQELPEEDVLELCDLLEAQDQIPLAISFLEKQCRYHSHSTKIYERLANYYLQNNQVLKAVRVYEKLVQENPQKRDYWVQLGQLYTWNEQQMQAIKAYEKAIKLDSTDVQTMRRLNQLYLWNGRELDAFLLQRKILRQEPQDLALWKEHGIQARWLGKNIEAIASFKNILIRDPQNTEALFLLGETYLWMDKTKEAEICFRQVLKMQPDHLQARFYYSQLRQWQPFGWWEARNNYRWILQRQPNHQESQKYLRLIRKNYGPLLKSTAYYIHDSNELKKTQIMLKYQRYLSARWLMCAESFYRRLEEQKSNGHFISFGEGARLGAKLHLTQRTRFFVWGGFVGFNQAENFALVEFQWQQTLSNSQSWPGELYSTLSLNYDQILDGVLAIKRKLTAKRIQQSFYWEPSSPIHIGSDLQYSWYSDDNRKTQLYLSGEYRFYSGFPSLFLKLLFAYEDMTLIYPDAVPYWTPDNFWTRSIGLDALLPVGNKVSLRGGFALTQQSGNELASNWKAEVNWHPNDFSHIYLNYQDFGSRYYSYRNFQGGFSYRW